MTEVSSKKRYTPVEIAYLSTLVMERKNVIENKESDAVSLQQKRRAWDEVAQEFNDVPTHTKRTVAQLMKCWENVKGRKKRELAERKREVMKTGGGRGRPSPQREESDATVEAFVDEITDIELPTGIGSDSIAMTSTPPVASYVVIQGSQQILEEEVHGRGEESLALSAIDSPLLGRGEESLPRSAIDSPLVGQSSVGGKRRRLGRGDAVAEEVAARSRLNEQKMRNEEELHQLRADELRLRREIAEIDRQRAQEELERARSETAFRARMHKLEEELFISKFNPK